MTRSSCPWDRRQSRMRMKIRMNRTTFPFLEVLHRRKQYHYRQLEHPPSPPHPCVFPSDHLSHSCICPKWACRPFLPVRPHSIQHRPALHTALQSHIIARQPFKIRSQTLRPRHTRAIECQSMSCHPAQLLHQLESPMQYPSQPLQHLRQETGPSPPNPNSAISEKKLPHSSREGSSGKRLRLAESRSMQRLERVRLTQMGMRSGRSGRMEGD